MPIMDPVVPEAEMPIMDNTSTFNITAQQTYITLTFFDNLFMVTSAVCCLYGTLGNASALPYFLRQKHDIPNRMYILIITVDITTSLLMLPICVSYMSQRAPALFSSLALCQVGDITHDRKDLTQNLTLNFGRSCVHLVISPLPVRCGVCCGM